MKGRAEYNGPTLGAWLSKGLAPDEVLWLALALMRGLQTLHQLGVVHCDLKPLNVLIHNETAARTGEPTWTPKIIDFGLAVLDGRDADSEQTAQGRMAGTPGYMAPEQVQRRMLSPTCDIYAVGVILWEAISGRRAFAGEPFAVMVEQVQRTSGLRVGGAPPGLPPVLLDLIERCTSPDPSQRPSAAEAIELLERLGPTQAPPNVIT